MSNFYTIIFLLNFIVIYHYLTNWKKPQVKWLKPSISLNFNVQSRGAFYSNFRYLNYLISLKYYPIIIVSYWRLIWLEETPQLHKAVFYSTREQQKFLKVVFLDLYYPVIYCRNYHRKNKCGNVCFYLQSICFVIKIIITCYQIIRSYHKLHYQNKLVILLTIIDIIIK